MIFANTLTIRTASLSDMCGCSESSSRAGSREYSLAIDKSKEFKNISRVLLYFEVINICISTSNPASRARRG